MSMVGIEVHRFWRACGQVQGYGLTDNCEARLWPAGTCLLGALQLCLSCCKRLRDAHMVASNSTHPRAYGPMRTRLFQDGHHAERIDCTIKRKRAPCSIGAPRRAHSTHLSDRGEQIRKLAAIRGKVHQLLHLHNVIHV